MQTGADGAFPRRETAFVHFGTGRIRLNVEIDTSKEPGAIWLSRRVQGRLGIPRGMSFQVGRQIEGVRVGSFVGVLVSTETGRTFRRGHPLPVYEHFVRCAAERGGQLVFFTYRGVHAHRNRVLGYVYNPQRERFVPVRSALPRVIYDRCFGFRGRTEAYSLRRRVRGLRVTVINRAVKLTKWSVYNAVQSDPELRSVVPFYAPLSRRTFLRAAKKYPVLYLKPNGLSKGYGVCRVSHRGGRWLYEYTRGMVPRRHMFRRAADMLRFMVRRFPYPYVMQEGIDLALYHGNPYDFRALVQKNGAGDWQLTGLVARIAPERGVITSPRSGGRVASPERVLSHSFGAEGGQAVFRTLNDVCLCLARRLEGVYGLCVEIGLDVGVTRKGHIRLIEANGRPLKVSLDRLGDPVVNARIHRYPIHFASALDGR